ncbi:hypothetical protein B484DRAFT_453505 [Ochromonadaceae sp. CCMP2298]|nr:hypothetical protein B484DRAFT_453505 [Ochromonadaceae sp. CCMP2298]
MAPDLYLWVLIASALINGIFWYRMGRRASPSCFAVSSGSLGDATGDWDCPRAEHGLAQRLHAQASPWRCAVLDTAAPRFRPLLTKGFMAYKEASLVTVPYPDWSVLLQPNRSARCDVIANPHVSRKRQFLCLAVASVQAESSYNLLRFEETTPPPPTRPKHKNARGGGDSTDSGDSGTGASPPRFEVNLTGFFYNVANDKGRRKLSRKMSSLLPHLDSLQSQVAAMLHSRGLLPGADVVVMVVNAGEMDLLANFCCSCRTHNVSTRNMLVFAGSPEVVPLIESLGCMGLHHAEAFASVSRNASYEYLDGTFIDMMWYKSFSVWLLLKMQYNVLFQDVDLVWFRDPVQYFRTASQLDRRSMGRGGLAGERVVNIHSRGRPSSAGGGTGGGSAGRGAQGIGVGVAEGLAHLRANLQNVGELLGGSGGGPGRPWQTLLGEGAGAGIEGTEAQASSAVILAVEADSWGHSLNALPQADAYLSDDGQRSLRYTPFFANSGFFYLVANARTLNFSWSVLTAFAVLHITGSHQNVFTTRLIEALDLGGIRPKLLSLREFPSGVKYQHDQPYMRAILDHHEHPFVFHMCWTRNKYDKLTNFRLASMWFLSEQHSSALGELGRLVGRGGAEQLRALADRLTTDPRLTPEQRLARMGEHICALPRPPQPPQPPGDPGR